MKRMWQRRLVSAAVWILVAGMCPVSAKDGYKLYWFGCAYRSDVRFTIMSRKFADPSTHAARRFVFLTDGLSTHIQHENTPALNSSDLRKVVSGVLQKNGFVPAQSTAEADVAVVIGYGRGYYPPPFQFAGVSMAVPERNWSPVLKEYRDHYAPVWLENDDGGASSGMTAAWLAERTIDAPRGLADQVNLITIKAYNWSLLHREHQLKLLWETRVTTPARKRPLETYAAAMLDSAGPHFDREEPQGIVRRANELNGEVKLGPLESFGESGVPVTLTEPVMSDSTPFRGQDVRSLP